jgi:flagellar biosynthesis chaperone FliJ
MDIFVYYRVYSEHTEKCHSSILSMQKQLRINHDIQTDLKCRVNQDDKNPTWMEIYSHVPEEFISVLEQAVIAAKVDAFIEGSRHIEVFEDI